ncbi:MAG TPA: GntR family transcriptional regulator [Streptosporangiaceae bacterium]|nr:GntR family transcriptional regulator [Streptosporangiaceae bacterium]
MAEATAKETRATAVRNQMRQDILAGRLKPGQRLMSPDLCARYDASVGVTREALTWLEGQGLVRAHARQGHIVTPLSRKDLEDLTLTRTVIEPIVLRLSIEHRDIEWESNVVAAHYTMTRTYKLLHEEKADDAEGADNLEKWSAAHANFHDALFRGCPVQRLMAIARKLSEEASLYRRWSDSLVASRDVMAEHLALMDAAVAGDVDLASRLLTDHIARTATGLITYTDGD